MNKAFKIEFGFIIIIYIRTHCLDKLKKKDKYTKKTKQGQSIPITELYELTSKRKKKKWKKKDGKLLRGNNKQTSFRVYVNDNASKDTIPYYSIVSTTKCFYGSIIN
ncbi:hypothetical protein BLOT_003493 [Blomia tropicalis]|nr:hypothetical protein BLOT_003493 [Blomia tropicalis]